MRRADQRQSPATVEPRLTTITARSLTLSDSVAIDQRQQEEDLSPPLFLAPSNQRRPRDLPSPSVMSAPTSSSSTTSARSSSLQIFLRRAALRSFPPPGPLRPFLDPLRWRPVRGPISLCCLPRIRNLLSQFFVVATGLFAAVLGALALSPLPELPVNDKVSLCPLPMKLRLLRESIVIVQVLHFTGVCLRLPLKRPPSQRSRAHASPRLILERPLFDAHLSDHCSSVRVESRADLPSGRPTD